MSLCKAKFLVLAVVLGFFPSRTMPAQTLLPELPADSRIQYGMLGCGASYYMVKNPVRKGYAEIALVQKDDPLTASKREQLSSAFLARMGVSPGPGGYLAEKDSSTIYDFRDVRYYLPQVMDSVLLYTFSRMAVSRCPQAIIVSGDIDPGDLKRKMDIFSLLVNRLPQPSKAGDYVWTTRPAPEIHILPGGPATITVGYSGSRIPCEQMNTAQALVTDLFSLEFKLLLKHRLEIRFREAGLPYSEIEFLSRRSVDSAADEQYAVRIKVAPGDLEAALELMSRTISELDTYGPGVEEFAECKEVLLPSMERRAYTLPSAQDYTARCISHFLFGAQLAPYTEPLRFFARKKVSDSTETRLFASYADALLSGLENLELSYGPVQDSDTTDTGGDVLFRYQLGYLLGSLSRSGLDYTWHAADTAGFELRPSKLKIKGERAEAVSGGTLWTLSNGMRVIYKQVKGSGRFSYALQLNGGLSQINGLKEGEGGYIGDLLFLDDAAGLPAPVFQDVLASNGISLSCDVALNSLVLSGDAPSDRLALVLKALASLAYNRNSNPSLFQYYLRCQALGEAEDPVLGALAPGYKYATLKNPSVLSEETQKKAWKYFDDRFSRMNDGVFILCGDLSPERAKRHLIQYLGAFHVVRGGAVRKTVEMRTLSGTSTLDRADNRLRVIMDTDYPFTANHYYVSQMAMEQLRLSLLRHLSTTGYVHEIKLSYLVQPQERFRIDITAWPSREEEPSAITALRAAIADATASPVSGEDLSAWKAKAVADVEAALSEPQGFITTLLVRYAANKDVLTGYKETIGSITASDIQEFLKAAAAGGRVESFRHEQ